MPCARAEQMLVVNEFHVAERGTINTRPLVEMSSADFQAIATAACAAYGCSSSPDTVKKAPLVSADDNFYITGEARHEGDEWRGIFRAPQGYEICAARLALERTTISGFSTFTASIVRTPQNNGLGFYAVIPKGRIEAQWVEAYFFVKYVTAGTVDQDNCAPTDSNPWLCKGPNCSNSRF
jgi:hypothetical protein